MLNAFSVLVDGKTIVKRCVAQALVGATTLSATIVVLARVVTSVTAGAP
jgi:hypothetical protein